MHLLRAFALTGVLHCLDRYCWKGHTDFAFAEDGIIIIHSQRNFPVAADVMLFW